MQKQQLWANYAKLELKSQYIKKVKKDCLIWQKLEEKEAFNATAYQVMRSGYRLHL